MPTTENRIHTYNTLEEIRLRKDQLSEAIETDNEKIGTLWNSIFTKREDSTKGEYIASMVTNTITAVDAFLLVRKLIKNYSGILSLFSRNKKKKRSRF